MSTNKRLKEVYRETAKTMKPVRGSERAPSKAPKGKKTGEKPKKPGEKTRQRRVSREEPQPGTSSQVPQPKPQKKKGAAVAGPRKAKGQEKWKPLTKSSITALDNILGLSILFLSKLAQLSVPIQNQEMTSHASRQHQEETRKAAVGKKSLNKLAVRHWEGGGAEVCGYLVLILLLWVQAELRSAELRSVVASLEQQEGERDSLERQCFNLRQLLDQEEERNQQEQMLRLVPSGDSITTRLHHLAKTLQTSGPVQDAKNLLELAYRHADHLITPPTAVSQ
ncbi:unnamed protein product [Coregonus sp. 'balchen']|nr:unnamed protein product [Coregonus sp. 'balchen']